MTLLTWNHACTVGVRAMDDQHGILMDTMNELRLAVVRGSGKEQLNELLNRLIQFAAMHFQSEEQLLEQTGFPGLAAHRSAHQRLLAYLRESADRVQHCEDVPMHPVLCGMRDGYLEHLEGPDQLYGPWLNERGVD